MDQQSSTNFTPPETPPRRGKGAAIAAIVLGVFALLFPLPFFNLFFGIVGVGLAAEESSKGTDWLSTVALIVSILGAIWAVFMSGAVIWYFL